MLTQANSGHTMRPGDNGDYTVNEGSCLSASTLASSSVSTQLLSPLDKKVCIPKKQNDVRKRVFWGIEVAEELQWKGWELGKESTRNLSLKNLSLKIQKIKYRYQDEEPRT